MPRHRWYTAVLLAGVAAAPLRGQALARDVVSSDGLVQVVYPSRPNACGDGETFIGNVFGRGRYMGNGVVTSGWGDRWNRPCVHGPARLVATVIRGEVTRLRVYVGPVPPPRGDTRTLTVGGADAAAWLGQLVSAGDSRIADQAIVPLILADSPDPWPLLLRVARDANRPANLRTSAMLWLSNAVSEHLGIADADERATDDDEVRAQAVFAVSQRPAAESVPELIDVARTNTHPAVRKAALFWLSQKGDARAADLYAELLGIR